MLEQILSDDVPSTKNQDINKKEEEEEEKKEKGLTEEDDDVDDEEFVSDVDLTLDGELSAWKLLQMGYPIDEGFDDDN